MNIYRQIIAHEWRVLWRDKTLLTVALLFAAVTAYGIYNGVSWKRGQESNVNRFNAQREEMATRYRDDLLKYETERETNPKTPKPQALVPQAFGVTGYYVSLPFAPLAALSIGQGDIYPIATKVTMYGSRADLFTEIENENPLNLLAGNFDFAFVLIYLYPLLILVLGYNILSAERESGILAMILAQPVSLKQVALGKIALRANLIFGLTTFFTLAGAVLSGMSFNRYTFLQVILWLAVVVLYGGFWFALAVAVNAFGKNSATNATALAVLWLLFVLVIPSAINLSVNTIYPTPSRLELVQTTRRAANEAEEEGAQLLSQYFQDHPELVPGNKEINLKNQAQIYLAVQQKVSEQIEPQITKFEERTAKQQSLVNFARFLSPSILTQEALNEIAGTSANRFQNFRVQAELFKKDWESFFIPKVFRVQPMTSQDYEIYPRFNYQEEASRTIILRIFASLLGLAIPTLLIVFLSLKAMRRCSVAE